MKRMKTLILLFAVLLALAACGQEEDPQNPTISEPDSTWNPDTPTPQPGLAEPAPPGIVIEDDSQPPREGMVRSRLTNEWVDADVAATRPIAVTVPNEVSAIPHYNLSKASVVYEANVEGRMSRMMAIYEGWEDLEKIGNVRSLRTYFIYWAFEWDAFVVHLGGPYFINELISEPTTQNIDGLLDSDASAFFRSSDRPAPHNAYASFDKIQKAIEALGYSQEYSPDYDGHYRFAKDGESIVLENSLDARRVVPGYSLNNPYFVYSEEEGLYHRYQYGAEHEGSEGPIAVKNLILQYCSTGHYATTEYLNIDVHTSQYGYYITNGRAIPLSWEKDGQFGVTHYYNVDKEEITLNQGKTWICIIPTSDFDKTEIYGQDD